MNVARVFAYACFSLVLSLSAPMVYASPLSLYEAWQYALNNDSRFRAATHEAAAGEEFRNIGRSYLLPNVQFNYSGGRNVSDVTREAVADSATTTERYRSHSAQLQLRQPVINWEYWARYRQGEALTEASQATFESRKQDLALRVIEAYVNVLLAHDRIILNQAQKKALLELRKVNEQLLRHGEGQRTDIVETEARYQMLAAREIEARDWLSNAMKRLEGIVGPQFDSAAGLFSLGSSYRPMNTVPADPNYWVELALSNNWALRARRHEVESAKEEISKTRAGHMPRVDVVASYGSSKSETINTLNTSYRSAYIGLQISVPIYAGGGVSSQVSQVSSNYRKASAELDGLRIEVLEEVRKQYDLTFSGIAKVRAYERAVFAADELIRSTQKGMEAGMRVNLDLLNAQEERFQALLDLAQARYETVASRLRLLFFAGTLQEQDIREASLWFNGERVDLVLSQAVTSGK